MNNLDALMPAPRAQVAAAPSVKPFAAAPAAAAPATTGWGDTSPMAPLPDMNPASSADPLAGMVPLPELPAAPPISTAQSSDGWGFAPAAAAASATDAWGTLAAAPPMPAPPAPIAPMAAPVPPAAPISPAAPKPGRASMAGFEPTKLPSAPAPARGAVDSAAIALDDTGVGGQLPPLPMDFGDTASVAAQVGATAPQSAQYGDTAPLPMDLGATAAAPAAPALKPAAIGTAPTAPGLPAKPKIAPEDDFGAELALPELPELPTAIPSGDPLLAGNVDPLLAAAEEHIPKAQVAAVIAARVGASPGTASAERVPVARLTSAELNARAAANREVPARDSRPETALGPDGKPRASVEFKLLDTNVRTTEMPPSLVGSIVTAIVCIAFIALRNDAGVSAFAGNVSFISVLMDTLLCSVLLSMALRVFEALREQRFQPKTRRIINGLLVATVLGAPLAALQLGGPATKTAGRGTAAAPGPDGESAAVIAEEYTTPRSLAEAAVGAIVEQNWELYRAHCLSAVDEERAKGSQNAKVLEQFGYYAFVGKNEETRLKGEFDAILRSGVLNGVSVFELKGRMLETTESSVFVDVAPTGTDRGVRVEVVEFQGKLRVRGVTPPSSGE